MSRKTSSKIYRSLADVTYKTQYILNLSMLSEVRIANFEYVYRVMRSEKLVCKSKVRTVYEGVRKLRFGCIRDHFQIYLFIIIITRFLFYFVG
jgi:hypothetical protein